MTPQEIETKIASLIDGSAEAPTPTLKRLVERMREYRAQHAEQTKIAAALEQQLTGTRGNMLAIEQRHEALLDEARHFLAEAESPAPLPIPLNRSQRRKQAKAG